MLFIVIIIVIISLSFLIKLIRQKFFNTKPSTPPDEVDLLYNPISHATPQEKHEPGENTVPIYKLSNIVEAHTFKALLEDNGIDCMVQSFHNSAFDRLWQEEKGWGILKVMEKDQSKAEDLINEFLKAKDQPDLLASDEMSQGTPIPISRTRPPRIFFVAAIILLLTVPTFVAMKISSEVRAYKSRWIEEGLIYSISKNHDKAIEYYDKAINSGHASGTKGALVYSLRGLAKFNKGDSNGAIADWEQAIKLDPSVEKELRPWIQKAKQK